MMGVRTMCGLVPKTAQDIKERVARASRRPGDALYRSSMFGGVAQFCLFGVGRAATGIDGVRRLVILRV